MELKFKCKLYIIIYTDNAKSMTNATYECGRELSLRCFAHTLNLAAQKGINIGPVKSLISTIRPVIKYFRSSYLGKIVLKEKQMRLSIPNHNLILDSPTRWNSTYDMVDRFIEQYPAIVSSTLDQRIRNNEKFKKLQRVEDCSVRQLEKIRDALNLLYKLTVAMSSEKRPTASMTLPMIGKLKAFYATHDEDDLVLALKTAIWNDLKNRYTGNNERNFLEEATALDPRFTNFTKSELVWARIQSKIIFRINLSSEAPFPASA